MSPTVRWIVVAALALALIGLVRYARGEPGDDGRIPEAQFAAVVHESPIYLIA